MIPIRGILVVIWIGLVALGPSAQADEPIIPSMDLAVGCLCWWDAGYEINNAVDDLRSSVYAFEGKYGVEVREGADVTDSRNGYVVKHFYGLDTEGDVGDQLGAAVTCVSGVLNEVRAQLIPVQEAPGKIQDCAVRT